MTIRPAILGEENAIARVHVQAWRETYRGMIPDEHLANLSEEGRASMWKRVLSKPQPDCRLWVAVCDKTATIVGFANGGLNRDPKLADYTGELFAIYVLKAHQGLGYGRALFERVAADLQAGGHRSMLLWVIKDNPTVGFYGAMGGAPCSEKVDDIGGRPVVELAMGWSATSKSWPIQTKEVRPL